MSLFIPPKDQLNKTHTDASASKRTQKQNNSANNSDNSNGICDISTSAIDDDFMILSLNGAHNTNNGNSMTSPISCN